MVLTLRSQEVRQTAPGTLTGSFLALHRCRPEKTSDDRIKLKWLGQKSFHSLLKEASTSSMNINFSRHSVPSLPRTSNELQWPVSTNLDTSSTFFVTGLLKDASFYPNTKLAARWAGLSKRSAEGLLPTESLGTAMYPVRLGAFPHRVSSPAAWPVYTRIITCKNPSSFACIYGKQR